VAAGIRGVRRFTHRVLQEIAAREPALTQPIEEQASRVAALRAAAADAERALADLGHLLRSEEERLRAVFASRQAAFLADALPEVLAAFDRAVAEDPPDPRGLWRVAHAEAQRSFRDVLERWQAAELPVAEQLYREAVARFTDLANRFLRSTQAVAGDEEQADVLLPSLPNERGFRTRSRFHVTELLPTTARTPLRWLVDVLTPGARLRRRATTHARAYLEALMRTNASRVTNDLAERVHESRRRLEAEIRSRLHDGARIAARALERAEACRAHGADAIAAELVRLATLRARTERLMRPHPEAA